jgi:hypothetical protein
MSYDKGLKRYLTMHRYLPVCCLTVLPLIYFIVIKALIKASIKNYYVSVSI